MEPLSKGTLLQNRYTIKRYIGKGAMGTVYLVSDARLPDDRVIKEMNPTFLEASEREQFMELFKQEAHMLSRLHHENLPKVIDYFFEGERYYLVMDYVDGKNLKEYRESNHVMNKDQIIKIISQISNVLEYLHGQRPPIIFRDLKPSNIMITDDSAIKLIDFGIARIFKESQNIDTVIVGTPGFAPPEQYGKRQTDERSDIYSLGATLYYLFTGEVPDLPDQKGRKEVEQHMNIPPFLKTVILKCLNPEPSERYAHVSDFKKALSVTQDKPLSLPEKEKEHKIAVKDEPVNTLLASSLTFGFMLIPSGIIALLGYICRSLMIPHLRSEITLILLSLLGAGVLTGLWAVFINKLRKIPGFNWEALIFVSLPFILLNTRNLFVLLVPTWGSAGTTLAILSALITLMYVISFILISFFRRKAKTGQEIKALSVKSKESFIGKSATVTVPLKPMGKIVIDGDEETFTASSQNGQFLTEGTRVRLLSLKMGDFMVEEVK
jgi:serine/threonine protein kinase